jgi:hypothetical protein
LVGVCHNAILTGWNPPVRTIGFQPVAPRAHRPAESRVNRPSPTRNTPPPAVVEQACQPVRQSGEAHRPDPLSVGFDCEESRRVNWAVFAKGTDRPGGLSPQRKPTQRSATPPPAVVEQACQPVRQSGEAHRHDPLSVGFDCEESRRVNRAVFAKGTDRPGGLSPQRKPTPRSATRFSGTTGAAAVQAGPPSG